MLAPGYGPPDRITAAGVSSYLDYAAHLATRAPLAQGLGEGLREGSASFAEQREARFKGR